MIRNILIILSLILLTSCEYDYIHNNPNHPQEYFGNWFCDSTYLNGVKNNNVEKRNFLIMQTGVDITLNLHNIASYDDWIVDEPQTTFTVLNSDNIELFIYKIVRKPNKLALELDNIIYYLSH